MALANDELKKLKEERDLAETTNAPETITVKSYPSPLGKSVSGPQISFRLLAGRIAYLPWDELFGRMKASAQDRMRSAPTSSEVTDTLGPIQGFRMRYVMQRIDTAQGTMMRMLLSELLPVSERLGEPLDLALKQGSEFQAKMAMVSPDRYTVTVWVYPDSFGEFRRLKELLYERGYEVAGFPIEPGQTIGASPYGFKSIAQ